MHFFPVPVLLKRSKGALFWLCPLFIHCCFGRERRTNKPCAQKMMSYKRDKQNKPTSRQFPGHTQTAKRENLHPLEGVLQKLTYSERVDKRPSLTFVKTAVYPWTRPEELANVLPARLWKTEAEAAVRRDPYEECAGCERRGDIFLVSSCNPPARVWAAWALSRLGAASGVKRCL